MADKTFTFTTKLLQARKTATGIQVPDEIIEKLGAGKRPPVKVTINGYTYRNTVAVMGGAFMVSVSAGVREQSGVNGGDMIKVTLELDTEPREVEVPAALQKLLAKNKAARTFFDSLSNSNKKRFIIPIEQAKTAETKNRRIQKAIEDLANNIKM